MPSSDDSPNEPKRGLWAQVRRDVAEMALLAVLVVGYGAGRISFEITMLSLVVLLYGQVVLIQSPDRRQHT